MIRTDGPAIEIVRRKGEAKGFVVIARRWVVERTLAWIGGAGASQRTGKPASPHPKPGPSSLQSDASHDASQGKQSR
jgi:transposase